MNGRRDKGDRQWDNKRGTNNFDDTTTKDGMDSGRLLAEANRANTKINVRISANSTGSCANESSERREPMSTSVSQSLQSLEKAAFQVSINIRRRPSCELGE